MPETQVLKLNPTSPDSQTIKFAAALLRRGGLVAFPTETVYGIGANLLNKKTIKRLREIKKRPKNKPFTVHISSTDTIREMNCEISPLANALIKNFWPGPLTIILGSKKEKIGFRMPANEIAKTLISESGVPVVAPSANPSGEPPSADAKSILKTLDGKIDLILDSGRTEHKMESTVIDTTGFSYRILRKGALSEGEIAAVLKELV